ncbi:16S rRNA (cytidine(1402)-2'-O)-methyltransferase [Flavimaricola marinus]|uniref:Ribosomal RNA small subunit methyltransferase I n=1 Tax=Flavimaricola marinus TaxID=1819565 RepID=A0A238L8K3_9RHOB|nr:16S rRNA (cytidine(1402)-2'-O)-methyltransferase [Flavimaricola marinus]SMY06027.1 Ribosomal RNA small subunit methyltransferase I [Flavimaricola marinus]
MNFNNKPISAGLYFVATPIGTARDITLRALDILANADLIAAEDTRTARKLMEIHGVPLGGRSVIAYHDHSGPAQRAGIVSAVKSGKSVAYVSEAGTPLVADPGYALGRALISEGLPVFAAPGASAVLAALAVAGLPTDRFAFIGFLPSGQAQRETELAGLRALDMSLVFYESPKRISEMLRTCASYLGEDRQAAVCRELTKRFEEVRRGQLADLADWYETNPTKGEIVVVVGRPSQAEATDDDIKSALQMAMRTMRVKDAATAVAGAMGLPRRQIYQLALELSSGDDADET